MTSGARHDTPVLKQKSGKIRKLVGIDVIEAGDSTPYLFMWKRIEARTPRRVEEGAAVPGLGCAARGQLTAGAPGVVTRSRHNWCAAFDVVGPALAVTAGCTKVSYRAVLQRISAVLQAQIHVCHVR